MSDLLKQLDKIEERSSSTESVSLDGKIKNATILKLTKALRIAYEEFKAMEQHKHRGHLKILEEIEEIMRDAS